MGAPGFAVRGDEMTERFRYLESQPIEIDLAEKKLLIPTSIEEAVRLKHDQPLLRIVSGATDLGVLHNKGKQFLDEALVLNRIPMLSEVQRRRDGLWIGSMVDLSRVEAEVRTEVPELGRLLRIFASPQIKHQGTLVGNILNGSPIGDTIPGLMVLEAKLCLVSASGERWVNLVEFYKGYKQMDIRPEEICTGILVPKLAQEWAVRFFKVSLRKDLDISAVTFAGMFRIDGSRISEARLALGGVGPTVVRLLEVEKQLVGQEFTEASFATAGETAIAKISPISDLRASADYRRAVTKNLFTKCYHEIQNEVQA